MISDQLRTKQGPLARVWLASHWERKISKSQFLNTNLEKTIDAITTNQQEEPIALRISGQLLLGVVRIYSRKTKYLLEDCNEALVKIKLAFNKGNVNMPDIHQTGANINTITLQDKLTEFEILLPDLPFNQNGNLADHDPILDSLGEFSMSQDITLSDVQNSFSFGNWETGRGVDGGIEVGRRDNEAGLANNEFDMDTIADPLKDMNLSDNNNNNGLANDNIEFDFDLNDNIDYGADEANMYNPDAQFDLNTTTNISSNEASLDTLMQDGIVAEDENVFGMDHVEENVENTVRRRKRLAIDRNTEIPQEDLRRYYEDVSSIINNGESNTSDVPRSRALINLTQPHGGNVGFGLESMVDRLNKKRRHNEATRQARSDDPFSAPTPAAGAAGANDDPFATTAFQFDDYDNDAGGYEDMEGGFDAEAAAQFGLGDFGGADGGAANANASTTETDEYDMLDNMYQNTQSFNTGTRRTLETLENQFVSQDRVQFGELASSTYSKSDAAKLFYDILLLSTKDKIKVKQDRPFGEIQISPVSAAH